MKVTIAMDDLSIPLPKMRRPDVRQSMLEAVLPLIAAHGVDDVHLIFATSFHRRVQPDEMRRMLGDAVFAAFYPDRLYNHDGEAPDGMVELGTTDHGERVRLNRRAAESDLLIYLNVNFVPMDGGTKSVGVGLCDYPTLQAHHTPATIRDCDSLFDHRRSALTDSCDRIGRVIAQHLKVFHVETVLNSQTFDPAMAFFSKNEDRWNAYDHVAFRGTQGLLRALPRPAKR
jgi:nickel-dependent lactate racemase